MTDLGAELLAFDGKHTEPLESLATALTPSPAVIEKLCALAAGPNAKMQVAATWLLKRFHDDGLVMGAAQIEPCLDLFGSVTEWEARLHLLQVLPGISVPDTRRRHLYSTLMNEDYLGNGAKFVRAWTYNALAELADQEPAFRPEVAERLAAAEGEEAASVRARIRNIRKQMPWAQVI